jgi:hypothetical protein
MMMTLLILKSKIKTFYEKHYNVVRPLIKFFLVFWSLMLVTENMDYSGALRSYWILFALALFCGIVPDLLSAVVTYAVVGWEIFCAVPAIGGCAVMLIVIYFLLLGRIARGQAYVMLAVPLLSMLKLECVVPIVAALFVAPVMIPAMIFGIILQYIMAGVSEYANSGVTASEVANSSDIFVPFQYIVNYLLHNSMLMVTIVAFGVTFACVYLIRRTAVKNSSAIAIMVGTLMLLGVEFFANIIFDLNMNLLVVTLQALGAMLIAYVFRFFHITLDYHGTRKLQFEDDEYYYYVTAIPKYKVAVVDKTVTRIVPEEAGETLDLKEELEKTLEEEVTESNSER